ncbi:hypothetical protein D9758_017789 [Tetrapyrgos nigripes]|uniref:Xylanolytic transcriptional activator regulatory domain-containing protein n=1 Tax=Tetrapyrgos nigripes TaxID=182062 RepID=A0A8H5BRF9_9AGAR|nr:hypothetical protein D9758_017789 [Tetrapyrgos nigripes]
MSYQSPAPASALQSSSSSKPLYPMTTVQRPSTLSTNDSASSRVGRSRRASLTLTKSPQASIPIPPSLINSHHLAPGSIFQSPSIPSIPSEEDEKWLGDTDLWVILEHPNAAPLGSTTLPSGIHSWQYPIPSYIWPPASVPNSSATPQHSQSQQCLVPYPSPLSSTSTTSPSTSTLNRDGPVIHGTSNQSLPENTQAHKKVKLSISDAQNAKNLSDFPKGPTEYPHQDAGNLSTPEHIVQALEGNVAFIDGDPSRQEELELYYYRFSGSTAIHPGINRISLKLHPRTRLNGGHATSPIAAAPVPSHEHDSDSNEDPTTSATATSPHYRAPHSGSSTSSQMSPVPDSSKSPPTTQDYEKMFDDSGLPLPSIYRPLLDTFFRTLGRHFPSISKKRMDERLETGTMSAFLLNCICALAARFHPLSASASSSSSYGSFPPNFNSALSSESPPKACAPFITKAQELIIPLLHLPTYDSITGLLLLAWANYGMNSESMAIRMAIDLGLHEVSEIYESPEHVVRSRMLFWSLFITDRIVAFSTGRPVSISEEIIEIPLPSNEDLTPDPCELPATDPSQIPQVQPNAFVYLVRLLVLCGRIGNVLNGRRGRTRTLIGPYQGFVAVPDGNGHGVTGASVVDGSHSHNTTNVNDVGEGSRGREVNGTGTAGDGAAAMSRGIDILAELQAQLVQYYAELPEAMRWTVDAFRCQEARGHGGVFLTLHLWANAVLALVYHPELLTNPSGTETPMTSGMDRSLKLSLASSRLISECLVFADLFASQSYLASPFVVQPIYVASLAFAYDVKLSMLGMRPDQQPSSIPAYSHRQPKSLLQPQRQQPMSGSEAPRTADLLLTSLARQNLSVFVRALQRMEHYWAGVSYVSNLLEVKTKGLIPGNSGLFEDDNENGKKRKNRLRTFISLPDKGLLRRFTDKNLPHNTAPPTETSLRTEIFKRHRSSASPGSAASTSSPANSTGTPSSSPNTQIQDHLEQNHAGDGTNHGQRLAPNADSQIQGVQMQNNTYSLDDLLSMYSVHDMFVQPVQTPNSYEFQNLLGGEYTFTGSPLGLGPGNANGGMGYDMADVGLDAGAAQLGLGAAGVNGTGAQRRPSDHNGLGGTSSMQI